MTFLVPIIKFQNENLLKVDVLSMQKSQNMPFFRE